MRPTLHHQHDQTEVTMAESLSNETVDALLKAIKKHAEEWEDEPSSVGAAGALKDLAEAYAWIQRPIRGTAR
ncbi:hypothetical protein ACQ86D_26380 [Streptomyces galilaeus]